MLTKYFQIFSILDCLEIPILWNIWIIEIFCWTDNINKYNTHIDPLYKLLKLLITLYIMESSNAKTFRVTGHLCREFTGHRWIPRTKASDAELWSFLWSAPE